MLPRLTSPDGISLLYGCSTVADVTAVLLEAVPERAADILATLPRDDGYQLWNRWVRREAASLPPEQAALLPDLDRFVYADAVRRASRLRRPVGAYGEPEQAEREIWEARDALLAAADRLRAALARQARQAKEHAEILDVLHSDSHGWDRHSGPLSQVDDRDEKGRPVYGRGDREPRSRGVSLVTGENVDRRKH